MPGDGPDGAALIGRCGLALLAVLAAGPVAAGSLTREPGQVTVQTTPGALRAHWPEGRLPPVSTRWHPATGGARVVQAGRGNSAAVTSGAGNAALVVQAGRGHAASVTQTGSGQGAVLIQTGTGGQAEVVQQTDGARTVIVQHGWVPRG